MITNTGKTILAKYLINTAPSYAAYISVGCGPEPRNSAGTTVTNASSTTTTNVITVTDTANLFVGAKIIKTAGTGVLSEVEDTIVTDIIDSTRFLVNVRPTTQLSGATLEVQTDPAKNVLDFEMFRVPITSRGYVNDAGTNKIIFTAQLPTEERYEISEIGVFSAGANTAAGQYDSKILYGFTQDENWEYHNETAAVAIPTITAGLDPSNDNIIVQASPVFQTNADNRVFANTNRIERHERLRFLNNVIMMRGDTANLTKSVNVSTVSGNGTTVTYTTALPHTLATGDTISITGVDPSAYNLSNVVVASVPTPTTFTVTSGVTGIYVSGGSIATDHLIINSGSDHIHLAGVTLDLNRNAPTDLIKMAFSIINKDGTSSAAPDIIRLILDFASSDSPNDGQFARLEIDIKDRDDFDYLYTTNLAGTYNAATKTLTASANGALTFEGNNVTLGSTARLAGQTTLAQNGYYTVTQVGNGSTPWKLTLDTAERLPIATNRYFVIEKQLQELYKSVGFTWNSVDVVKIFTSTFVNNAVSQDYYVGLDAIRLDNVSTQNPLYGMTGYSIIQSQNSRTILKSPNTTNYIEYRFILDVT